MREDVTDTLIIYGAKQGEALVRGDAESMTGTAFSASSRMLRSPKSTPDWQTKRFLLDGLVF
jgi:hypothetical protein